MIQFSVGGGVRLHLHAEPWYVVTIEGGFRCSRADEVWSGQPLTVPALERLLPLLMRDLTSATVDQEGGLSLDFGDSRITVPVDDSYEAWQVSADDGLLVVSTPGGALSYWTPTPKE